MMRPSTLRPNDADTISRLFFAAIATCSLQESLLVICPLDGAEWAFSASLSATSLPAIDTWLGIHNKVTLVPDALKSPIFA